MILPKLTCLSCLKSVSMADLKSWLRGMFGWYLCPRCAKKNGIKPKKEETPRHE